MDFVRSLIRQNMSMYLQHAIRREDRQQGVRLSFNILINLFMNEKADLEGDAVRSGTNQGNNQNKKEKEKKDKGRDRKTKGDDRCVPPASVCETKLFSLKMMSVYGAP
jgi:hypothetical protein